MAGRCSVTCFWLSPHINDGTMCYIASWCLCEVLVAGEMFKNVFIAVSKPT